MIITTEHKIFLGIGLATVLLLVGGIFIVNKQDERLKVPLMGEEVAIISRNHLPDGTKIDYNSNPPAAGDHYAQPQDAGIYAKAPADGHLVHSLEHGAVILWYQSNLPANEVEKLKSLFNTIPIEKKIMTTRDSLDVPFALSSWGRVLKLQAIDEKQIRAFFEVNHDRSPENAPI